MVGLTGLIGQLEEVKVLVVGDLVQDAYVIGTAKRISPEAPVPVVNVTEEFYLPGGAGNVMLNLCALGANVVALGRVGEDSPGKSIKKYLKDKGIAIAGILEHAPYRTPVKRRIIANNQQMVRVDYETIEEIPEALEQTVIDSLPTLFEGIQAVAISDYGKGFLSTELLQALLIEAAKRQIPVIVDPKGLDYSKYRGATIIKPNLSEAIAASGLEDTPNLDAVANKLLETTHAEVLMITRSSDGISLFYPEGKQEHFAVKIREVKDVTGAGDTVLAMVTLAIASGLAPACATQLANVAAGLAIEMLGCTTVTMEQLARRLLENDYINKIFDEKHTFALKAALSGRKLKVLGLSSKRDLSVSVLRAIFDLSSSKEHDLMVYIQDEDPDEDFVYALSAIQEVNFIILKRDSLTHLCQEMSVDEVFLHNGETVKPLDSLYSLYR